jgi:hypothetical protein
MLRKLWLLAVLVTALVGAGAATGVAAADNGATTAHFTAAYFNGQGGFFTCSGERIAKTAPKAFTKDSETCTISDLSTWPPGTYPIVTSPLPPPAEWAIWFSDFDGQQAVSGTIVVTDNGDGTGTMNIDAYYP